MGFTITFEQSIKNSLNHLSGILFILSFALLCLNMRISRANILSLFGCILIVLSSILQPGFEADYKLLISALVGLFFGIFSSLILNLKYVNHYMAILNSLFGLTLIFTSLSTFYKTASTSKTLIPFELYAIYHIINIGAVLFSGSIIIFIKLLGCLTNLLTNMRWLRLVLNIIIIVILILNAVFFGLQPMEPFLHLNVLFSLMLGILFVSS